MVDRISMVNLCSNRPIRKRYERFEEGVTWIEYVFVLAFMAIIALTAKELLYTKGKAYYSNAKQNIGQSYPSPFYTSGD